MNNKNSVNLSLNALQAAYASGELTPRILLQQLREQALQQKYLKIIKKLLSKIFFMSLIC